MQYIDILFNSGSQQNDTRNKVYLYKIALCPLRVPAVHRTSIGYHCSICNSLNITRAVTADIRGLNVLRSHLVASDIFPVCWSGHKRIQSIAWVCINVSEGAPSASSVSLYPIEHHTL